MASLGIVAMLVACNGEGDQGPPTGNPGMVDVGGRMLYLTCLGEGSPTVVLEGGGEGNSASWRGDMPCPT